MRVHAVFTNDGGVIARSSNLDIPGVSNLQELAAELVATRFLLCTFDGDDHPTLLNTWTVAYIEPLPAHLSAVSH